MLCDSSTVSPYDPWSMGIRSRFSPPHAEHNPPANDFNAMQVQAYQQALQAYYANYSSYLSAFSPHAQSYHMPASYPYSPSSPMPVNNSSSTVPAAAVHSNNTTPAAVVAPSSSATSSPAPSSSTSSSTSSSLATLFPLFLRNLDLHFKSNPTNIDMLIQHIVKVWGQHMLKVIEKAGNIKVDDEASNILCSAASPPSSSNLASSLLTSASALAAAGANNSNNNNAANRSIRALLPLLQAHLSTSSSAPALLLYHVLSLLTTPLLAAANQAGNQMDSAVLTNLVAVLVVLNLQSSPALSPHVQLAIRLFSSSSPSSTTLPNAAINVPGVNAADIAAQPAAAGAAAAPAAPVVPPNRFARYIDMKVLLKCVLLFFLFAQDGSYERSLWIGFLLFVAYLSVIRHYQALLSCCISVLTYVRCVHVFVCRYQVGAFRRDGNANAANANANGAPAANPGARPAAAPMDDEEELEFQRGHFGAGAAIPPMREDNDLDRGNAAGANAGDGVPQIQPATGLIVGIEKFVVGFFASLVPSWRPVPVPVARIPAAPPVEQAAPAVQAQPIQ